MRILITGATGFIGGHLTRSLLAEGHHLTALVRPSSDCGSLRTLDGALNIRATEGGLGDLRALVSEARPDVTIHLATRFVAQHGPDDVVPLIEDNITFPALLLEALSDAKSTRFLNASTAWQNYDNADYSPASLYAATKQAFIDLLRFYVDVRGFSALDLRLNDTYGPGDTRPKLFSLLYRAAEAEEAMAFSAGEQKIDPLHVDDVSRGFLAGVDRLSAAAPSTLELYSLRAGRPRSLREVVRVFEEATGRRPNIDWGARPYREREMMEPPSAGEVLPGWAAQIELLTGLRQLDAARV